MGGAACSLIGQVGEVGKVAAVGEVDVASEIDVVDESSMVFERDDTRTFGMVICDGDAVYALHRTLGPDMFTPSNPTCPMRLYPCRRLNKYCLPKGSDLEVTSPRVYTTAPGLNRKSSSRASFLFPVQTIANTGPE